MKTGRLCLHTCGTAVHEKKIHGRTGKNRGTAVQEKMLTRTYRQKSRHGRVHMKNADTAVHILCTLFEFCTAALAFLDGLFFCVHFTSGIRLACCATAVAAGQAVS